MSKKSRFLIPVTALLAIGLLIAGLYAIQPDGGNGSAGGNGIGAGQPWDPALSGSRPEMTGSLAAFAWNPLLKDISAVAFKDAAGGDVSLADFRGKVLLVNLWATWCGPCRREMPHLNALQQELGGDDFQIIALSLDRAGPEAAQVFLDETGAEALTLYIDQTSDTGRKLGVFGLPATLLVDRQGRELGRLLGPADWHGAEAKALINWAVGLK